jgi:NAD(P)H-hydrate epimerase
MYGTGFRGGLEGAAWEAARRINEYPGYKLAADIPSGARSDDGTACADAVRADETVTFGFSKPSCLLLPAAALCGALTVADIGLPDEIADRYEPVFGMITQAEADVMKKRPRAAHKGRTGRAPSWRAAPATAARPISPPRRRFVSGAGLVTAAVPAASTTSWP